MINLNTNFVFYLSLIAIMTRSSHAAPVEDNQDEGIERGTDGRCQDDLLFHEETQKCYAPQTKGPCSNNMKLLDTLEGSSKGVCGCPKQGQIDGYYPIIFPNLLHPKENRCYQLYTKGFCATNEWLVQDETSGTNLKCAPNPCINHDALKNPVYVEGQCISLGSGCTFSEKGGIVGFYSNDPVPSCGFPLNPAFLTGVDAVECGPLKRMDLNGNCRDIVSLE